MRLGNKHQNPFQIIFSDFSGGLNTSASIDGIADNQLAIAVNVEVDHATGKLRTVAGTRVISEIANIFAAMYDAINKILLVVKTDKTIYTFDLENKVISGELGKLSGDLYPISTSWEDGLLIASGGKLQYYNGKKLITIENSPTATSVFVRAGRILVSDDTSIHYSSVGDEETWLSDTNDESSGIFVEAGYKDGGKLLTMINLSSDVLMIKNNRRVYRLMGEFPNWQMTEVSRNVDVSGRLGVCSVADSVFLLGRNNVYNVQTTNAYGDMTPQSVASLIPREIQNLPDGALLRYIPPLSQIWAISGDIALVFDQVTNSWYKRQFNSKVVDIITVANDVLIIKEDRVSVLDPNIFYDDERPLYWKLQCRQLISHYNYLLKRVVVSFSPLSAIFTDSEDGQIRVGGVVVNMPFISRATRKHKRNARRRYTISKGLMVYGNTEKVYGNRQICFNRPTIIVINNNVYRNKFLNVTGHGSKKGAIINSITLDLVEV